MTSIFADGYSRRDPRVFGADVVAALKNEPNCKRVAAAWLFRRAYYKHNRRALVSCGGVGALFHTLDTDSDYCSQLYTLAILQAIESDSCDPLDRDRDALTPDSRSDFACLYERIGALHSDEECIDAVEILTFLAEARPDAPDFVRFVPRVALLLQSHNARLTAAAALAVIVLGLNHAGHFGAVQPLLDLLRADDEDETTSALFAIVRLAHDNDANRNLFSGEVVEAAVVQLLDAPTYVRKCRVAEMAAYFVAGSDASQEAFLNAGGVTALLALLRDGRNHDKTHAAFVIRCVGENHGASKKALVAGGGIELLVQTLSCVGGSAQQRAASALQKLLTHDDGLCRQRIYQAGALVPLVRVLRGSTDSGKSEAARLLWSLAKNNEEYIIEMASQC